MHMHVCMHVSMCVHMHVCISFLQYNVSMYSSDIDYEMSHQRHKPYNHLAEDELQIDL